ncbi:SET domain-containing protein [Schizophyllum commune H4-8]|uniref:SET domain-containing protein n=1 Tax=Schizophyllum commune (strain H4-8 / FGSC 9210) TaxID=578458 RepID=D8QLZ6_SCHCM|nr:SET domain-containing protein [Schizophyllum commune H4-8]KAI5886601.1 SET domain-containing protein [Schizophyllum commune H4-8]
MSTRLPHATSVEPFEPRVTSYGGRGLFATKPISAGTLLRTCPAPYASAIYAPFRKEVCAHCFAYAFDAGKNAWNVKHDASPASRFCSVECMQSWAGEHDLSLVARVEKAVQGLAKSSLGVKKPVVAPVIAFDGAATDITMQDLDEAWQAAEAMDVKAGTLVLDEMEEEIMRFVLSAILRKYHEDTAGHAASAHDGVLSSTRDDGVVGQVAPADSSAAPTIPTSPAGPFSASIPTYPAGPFAAFLELQDNELQHVRTNPAILPAQIRVWLFVRLAVMGLPARGGRGSRESSARGSRDTSVWGSRGTSARGSPDTSARQSREPSALGSRASPAPGAQRTSPSRAYPFTATPELLRKAAVPEPLPKGTVPETLPKAAISEPLPKGTVPEPLPKGAVPELLPYLSTPHLLRAILARDHANAFGLFDMQETGESEMLGWAVYVAGSYFNHDCAPNVRKLRRGRALQFVTTRDVAPGEELCISYVDTQDTKASRAAQFAQHWNFVCGCGRCRGEKVEVCEATCGLDCDKQAQQS